MALTRADEPMNLEDAVIGLRAYKEVDQRMDHLWKNLNQAILLPRMDLAKATLPGIHAEDVSRPNFVDGAISDLNRGSWHCEDQRTTPYMPYSRI